MTTTKNIQLEAFRAEEAAQKAKKQNASLSALLAAKDAADAEKNKTATFDFEIDADTYHRKALKTGIVRHRFDLSAKSLEASIEEWKKINPRDKKVIKFTVIMQCIYDTLTDEPDEFIESNLGVTLSADSVTRVAKTGNVEVNFTNLDLHGIANGGHTVRVILTKLDELKKLGLEDSLLAYVPVTVYTGHTNVGTVAKLCDRLNKTEKVKQSQNAHMYGQYDVLIEALKDHTYFHPAVIKGATPPKNTYKLQPMLRLLFGFDKFTFKDGKLSNPKRVDLDTDKQGTKTFNTILSKQHAADYEPVIDAAGNVTEYRNSIKMVFLHAHKLLELVDKITAATYNDNFAIMRNVTSGVKGGISVYNKTENPLKVLTRGKKPVMVSGKDWTGWTVPLANAFRSNIDWNSADETIEFFVDNDALIKAALPEMLTYLAQQHIDLGNKPNEPARNDETYINLYTICERHMNEILASQP